MIACKLRITFILALDKRNIDKTSSKDDPDLY